MDSEKPIWSESVCVTGYQDFMAALQSPEFDGPGAEAWIVGEACLWPCCFSAGDSEQEIPNAWFMVVYD